MASLKDVFLVDTDGIDPEVAANELPLPPRILRHLGGWQVS